MCSFRALFLVFILLGCQGVKAEGSAGHNEQATKEVVKLHDKNEASNKDRVVCHYVRKTGTHFKTRICRTVAQIEEERNQALRDHGDALSGTMSSTTE